ncbi:hypothetical protein QQF64_015194 [Cirrhinus molitorella]|uniref:Ig-like domain-containing protein n=1 Tax=Cirrhinus molitorella TaxID=172907 RepID=A0ABR3NUH6_9TELE
MDLHSVILFCASAAAVFGNVIKPNKTIVFAEEGSSVILSCSFSDSSTRDDLHWYQETFAQSITPLEDKALKSEGEKVTLSCKYDGAVNNLHWYRQYPGSKPEFLAYIYPHGDTSKPLPDRFMPKVDKTNNLVSLEITDAELKSTAEIMTHWKRVLIILFTYLWGCDSLDSVEQKSRFQTAVEGETVTIKCTYSTTDTFPYLFWYQQEINGYPIYMLKKSPGSGEVDKKFEGRFDANLNTSATSVPLTIKNVRVSDSAVYYCALKPTLQGGACGGLNKSKVIIQFSYIANMIPCALLLLLLVKRDTMAQSITPQENKSLATVGETVTLSCKYEGTINNLHWYRQYPRSKPEFLAWIYPKGATSDPLPPRIIPKEDKNLVSLEISDAEVTDSAIYYCALTPTMTGNSITLYKNLLNNKTLSLQTM